MNKKLAAVLGAVTSAVVTMGAAAVIVAASSSENKETVKTGVSAVSAQARAAVNTPVNDTKAPVAEVRAEAPAAEQKEETPAVRT